jgi:hypothetical protein
VDNSSNGHVDVIMPVSTRKYSSDGHDDMISLVDIVFFLSQCFQMEKNIYYPLN